MYDLTTFSAARFDTDFWSDAGGPAAGDLNSSGLRSGQRGAGSAGAVRYSFGADEHIFVELSEEMSLEAFFKGLAITTALAKKKATGRDRDLPVERLLSGQVRP